MLKGMAKNPIVFALANPDPEISPELAIKARPDIIMATGRSDYANQVNNVLGFPYIFRGALDVRATEINEAMKLAAVRALADLAKLPVPDLVNIAYNEKNITFGKHYIIPKPIDPRLLVTVAPAVARAAMKSGVAKNPIKDFKAYENELSLRLGQNDQLMRLIGNKAKRNPQRVVMADAENIKILKAAQIVYEEGIATPILLGNKQKIKDTLKLNALHINKAIQIIDPAENSEDKNRAEFGEIFFAKSQRKGFNLYEAKKAMKDRNYYGAMMVETEMADALISGLTRKYSDAIRPALQVIGTHPKVKKIAGMYILITKQGPLFFADTTVNTNPNVDELVEITELAAAAVRAFNVTPRIAFLSYSNFGSAGGDDAKKMQKAVSILKERNPDMIVDGEIQANIAFNQELIKDNYPFSDLAKGEAPNLLIFPSLSAGNIAYNLLAALGKDMESMGPLVLGLNKPAHVLHLGSTVREIVNMVTIAVVDAQHRKRDKAK
jgi:malate dehydrogenase (oxaloacetate-decarboxylating)(NADP+)